MDPNEFRDNYIGFIEGVTGGNENYQFDPMNSSISFSSESSRQIEGESDADFMMQTDEYNFGGKSYGSGSMNIFNGGATQGADAFNIFSSEWPEFKSYMEKNFGEAPLPSSFILDKEGRILKAMKGTPTLSDLRSFTR